MDNRPHSLLPSNLGGQMTPQAQPSPEIGPAAEDKDVSGHNLPAAGERFRPFPRAGKQLYTQVLNLTAAAGANQTAVVPDDVDFMSVFCALVPAAATLSCQFNGDKFPLAALGVKSSLMLTLPVIGTREVRFDVTGADLTVTLFFTRGLPPPTYAAAITP